jgi:phage terminase large subunit-like protein
MLSLKSLAELEKQVKLEQAIRLSRSKLSRYNPYPKQKEFHAAGATHRERLLSAGNQVGKTHCGAAEAAFHLTGQYPAWWMGRRFDRPIRMWAASKTGEVTRDGVQRLLIGEPKDRSAWGTGLIPGDAFADSPSSRMGIPDAIDSVLVKHVSGQNSSLGFKSYDQGRQKFQGETLDVVWFDEEPEAEVYSEGLTRTNAVADSVVYMTFTPLLGMSEVVRRFLISPTDQRHVTTMTIDDAHHYSPEQRLRIIDSYPAHEREARIKGIPTLGSGRIFPVTEESITCEAFPVPWYYRQIIGIDFGWEHPFAAVNVAYDDDADTVYVTHVYRKREATPLHHSEGIKGWGRWKPVAWPHDGLSHDKGSGQRLKDIYEEHGLKVLPEHAQFEDGTTGVEAGISLMLERMQAGTFKVFSHLHEWFEEFRLYHREDGKVVKEYDDALCATRYAIMNLRDAEVKPKGAQRYRTGPSSLIGNLTSWMRQ